MSRSILAIGLLLLLTMAAAGYSQGGIVPPAGGSGSAGQAKRLEVARLLLEQSGIRVPPGDGPEAIRELAAEFRRWVSDAQLAVAAAPRSCLEDAAATPIQADTASILDILPPQGARLGRSLSFTFEIQDLPDKFHVVGDDNQIATLTNSENYTPTLKFSFRPGDVLLSSADLALALDVVSANSSLLDASVQFDPERRTFDSFSRSLRKGHRFLNALTFSGSATRRAEFENGSPLAPEYLREDKTATTWSLKFDSYLFFNPLAARESSYSAALGYGKLFGTAGVGRGHDPCDSFALAMAGPRTQVPRACLAALSRPRPKLAVLLPTIEVKSEDQFDFVRLGSNQYLPAAEDTLETLSFTWDLSRAFSLGASRKTALAILKNHGDLQKAGPTIRKLAEQDPQEIVVRKGSFVHRRLVADGGVEKVGWKVETPAGKKRICALPGVELTGDGVLIGVPEQEGVFKINVVVSDGLKQEASIPVQVKVLRGLELDVKEALMAKYLELSVWPERVADDLWFDELLRSWNALGVPALLDQNGVRTASSSE